MNLGLRFCFASLYVVGPAVALLALLCRARAAGAAQRAIKGWRSYVPTLLLPIEWLLPPALILLELGELEGEWLPLRFVGLAISLGGALVLIWGAVTLGRFLVHAATVFDNHNLIVRGPYRFVRHPIYSGYLALLLGSGLGMMNVVLLLIWPVSLAGILVQAGAEEQLLEAKFGQAYRDYAACTGKLMPRFRNRGG